MTFGTDSETSVGIEMTTSRIEREKQEREEYERRIADPIVGAIGQLGSWQIWMCVLIFMMKFPVGWHQLATVFLAPKVQFKCDQSENFTNDCSTDCDNEVIYDTSIFTNTIIMQYNLICGREFLADLSQTVFMFGILVGNVFFGMWSDKSGRRPPLVFAVILQLFCGIAIAFAPWFWLFVALRFLLAVATGGSMLTSFCLVMEIVGPKKREVMSILYQIPFNLGHASLAAFAYFLRDWTWYQFAISIPSIFFISYYWLIPESPRWLLAHKRIEKTVQILEKASNTNDRKIDHIRSDISEYLRRKETVKTDSDRKGTVIDLLRNPNLRVKTLCMCFNWFVCGLTFFGVSQYVGNVGGDIFVNVAVSGALGIPGTLLSIPLIKYWGRKKSLFSSNILAGVSLLIIAVLPNEENYLPVKIMLSSAGIFAMSVSFPNVYVYSGEIYPTVVRNAGMGISSMIARFGSMIAPQVSSTAKYGYFIPPIIFGVIPIIGAVLVLFLPETKGQPLPETIDDGENFGKKHKK